MVMNQIYRDRWLMSAKCVELVGGEIVKSDSPQWRDECLARHVLALPSVQARRAWLADHEKWHGLEARIAMQKTMTAVWEKAKVAA